MLALQPGHDHTISVPVLIGPLALRIVLLAAVCAVTCFAMLRAFLGEPGRTTAAVVTVCAAVGIVFELMLATGFDLPDQVAVLILAAIAVPLVLAVSRTPGAATATRHAERLAPWVLGVAAAAAFVEFTRALLGSGDKATLLHTGLMLALAGLSWYTFGLPRWRPGSVAVQIMAAGLASAAIAGAGYITALMSGA
jgi:phosphatidylserine synthase